MRDANVFNFKRALPRMVSKLRLVVYEWCVPTLCVFAELGPEESL